MRRFAATTSLALAGLCAACSGGSSSTASPQTPSLSPQTPSPSSSSVPSVAFAQTTLRIGEAAAAREIEVEVAASGAQIVRGLGYRDTLAPDAGMIFDLHSSRVPSFWMNGMRFALDMVWIGEDRRVVSVTAGVLPQPGASAEQLRRYSPGTLVRYVLELNAGAAASLGVTPGVQLSFALP